MFISCLHYIYTIFILYVQHVHMLLICFYTILYVKYLCVLSIFCDIVILNDFDIFQIWVNWTALLFLNIQYIICLVSWYPMISKDNPPANARSKRRKGDLFVQMFGLIPVKIWDREREFRLLVVWNMNFMTFHSVGNVIIPTDELHLFSEG
jgi:hypothetical protein